MELLKVIEEAAGLPIHALYSNKIENQIIYKLVPLTDDGIVRTDRLELNIATQTLEEAEAADRKIRKALLSPGDLKKNGVLDIYLNGGGTLKSEVAIHKLINYIIVTEVNING